MKKKIALIIMGVTAIILSIGGIYLHLYYLTHDSEKTSVLAENKATDGSAIYSGTKVSEQDLESELDIEISDTDNTIGKYVPILEQLLKMGEYKQLKNLLDEDTIKENNYICSENDFYRAMKQLVPFLEEGSYTIQPYKAVDFLDSYIVKLSVLPTKKGKNREREYDYDNAIEREITIFPKENTTYGFSWLPYNQKNPGVARGIFTRKDMVIKENVDKEEQDSAHKENQTEEKEDESSKR